MAVFISHSFDNKPEFDNIADALSQAKVPYWNPAEVKPGSSLRDQLREAVDDCDVCVVVATHRALESSWCGAELGAFWGARKPVIVYLAESSLKNDELPPIVQGDVWNEKSHGSLRELVNSSTRQRPNRVVVETRPNPGMSAT